jgi:hypothetical protein
MEYIERTRRLNKFVKERGKSHEVCGNVGPRRSGRGNTLAEPRRAAAIDNVGGRCSGR